MIQPDKLKSIFPNASNEQISKMVIELETSSTLIPIKLVFKPKGDVSNPFQLNLYKKMRAEMKRII